MSNSGTHEWVGQSEGNLASPVVDQGVESSPTAPFDADYEQLTVSVVLATNARERYREFSQAVESVLTQSYLALEVVLVVDEDRQLFDQIQREFGDRTGVVTHFNPVDEGLSASRNFGASVASGDIVVFTDDDVVADSNWIQELVDTYERRDVLATGGPAHPIWPSQEPEWLPSEFYWLVGVTHDGFADGDGEEEVRNTFGCNISFRRDAFLELGGFRSDLGKQSGIAIQGEEAELCARFREEFGGSLVYNPRAQVRHRVFPGQIDPVALCKRAFWQGYSKYVMQRATPNELDAETKFVAHLARKALPKRVGRMLEEPSLAYPVQLVMLFVLTALVGSGYLYGLVSRPPSGGSISAP